MGFWRLQPSNPPNDLETTVSEDKQLPTTSLTFLHAIFTRFDRTLFFICCAAIGFIILQVVCVLFNYYEAYANVYPASEVAGNIRWTTASSNAFTTFRWIFALLSMGLVGVPAIYLLQSVFKKVCKSYGLCVAVPFGVVLFVFLGILTLWPSYLSRVIMVIWRHRIWNEVCDGWDITAVLHGIQYDQIGPLVGFATIILAKANYTMQLAQDQHNPNLYSFDLLNAVNYTPPYAHITYNNATFTYTIGNNTDQYLANPRLSFPSLGLESVGKAATRFQEEYGPAIANLVHKTDSTMSNVLYTYNTSPGDCTVLKVCGMLEPEGDFQIAIGAVLIQHYVDSVMCSGYQPPDDG